MSGKVGTSDPFTSFSSEPVARVTNPDADNQAVPQGQPAGSDINATGVNLAGGNLSGGSVPGSNMTGGNLTAASLSAGSTTAGSLSAASPSRTVGGKAVCPYCGHLNEASTGPCARCTMEDTPATRQATRARIGPWYVLQARNPSAPGMKWSTLLALIAKNQVTERSIVRGPTTHQLWRFASQIKGLSREFGACYSCAGELDKTAVQCPHCDRIQEPPANPDSFLETRETPATRAAGAAGRIVPPQMPAVGSDIRARTPAPAAVVDSPLDDLSVGGMSRTLAPRTPPPQGDPDGILTAKELAAAFQLDFNPNAPQGSVVAPGKKKRSAGTVLFVLFLIAAGVTGAVVYNNPDYRAKTVELYNRAADWTRAQWQSLKQPNKNEIIIPGSTDSENVKPIRSAAPATPSVSPTVPSPEKSGPPLNETPKKIDPVVNPPAPAAQNNPTVPAPTKVDVPPAVATPEKSASPEIAVPAAQNNSIPTDSAEALELSRKLYVRAIDFEAKQDYLEAVKSYEKIKQLPETYWPGDLEVRLERAKQQLPK